MRKSPLVKLFLFCLGLGLLAFLIYRVGFLKIFAIISGAKLLVAFLGVLVYLAVIFVRSYKFFLLTRMIKNTVSYGQSLPFYLVNYLMGNLTPLKSGETATPFLLRKYLKIPAGQGFSIIVLDR